MLNCVWEITKVDGHQSWTVNFFQRFLRKILNCGDYTNDKHVFFIKQISDELQSIRAQNNMLAYMHHPIKHSRESPDFKSFSDFLEELETSFETIF